MANLMKDGPTKGQAREKKMDKKLFAYPDEVKGSGDHDNARRLFLPDHSPKISDRRFCWTLSNNVGFRLNKALLNNRKLSKLSFLIISNRTHIDIGGIYVVVLGKALLALENHSVVID